MLGSMIRLVESRGPTAEGIRPSKADTSEPACVNLKMLSMKSSTSCPSCTEILGNSQTSESDTSSGAGGLVHLTVDQGDLGGLVLQTDDASLNHLVVQIVTLTGSLSDSGKDGVTTMSLGDVVNQFHDQDSLADTS